MQTFHRPHAMHTLAAEGLQHFTEIQRASLLASALTLVGDERKCVLEGLVSGGLQHLTAAEHASFVNGVLELDPTNRAIVFRRIIAKGVQQLSPSQHSRLRDAVLQLPAADLLGVDLDKVPSLTDLQRDELTNARRAILAGRLSHTLALNGRARSKAILQLSSDAGGFQHFTTEQRKQVFDSALELNAMIDPKGIIGIAVGGIEHLTEDQRSKLLARIPSIQFPYSDKLIEAFFAYGLKNLTEQQRTQLASQTLQLSKTHGLLNERHIEHLRKESSISDLRKFGVPPFAPQRSFVMAYLSQISRLLSG